MSDILAESRAVLSAAGFRTMRPDSSATSLLFEDSNVLGALYLMDSVQSIYDTWESLQDKFLVEYASRLVLDPYKAWNCYTAFLSTGRPGKDDASRLFAIEEDFRGTRKLARGGVTNKSEIEEALGPLLPLKRLVTLAPEDVKSRLEERLNSSAPILRGLLDDIEVEKIAAALLEGE